MLQATEKVTEWKDVWKTANIYHSRGIIEKIHKERRTYFDKALGEFKSLEALGHTIPTVWKVDCALLLIKMEDLRKTMSLLTDVVIECSKEESKLSYDESTIKIICVPHKFEMNVEYCVIDVVGRILLGLSNLDIQSEDLAYILDLSKHCLNFYEKLKEKSTASLKIENRLVELLSFENQVKKQVDILYHRCDT